MTKPIPSYHRRRPLLLALVSFLVLASCARGGDDRGLATARGVSRTFCQAFADLAASSKEASAGKGMAGVERDARAVLEVVPDDAPGEVADFFGALGEMAKLSQVWENPATGGIKEEYVDDFQRLTGVVLGDEAKAAGRFVGERCPGTATGGAGPLSGLGGSRAGAPGGGASATTGEARPAKVTVLLEDGPAGVYERVKVDVGRVTATDADPTNVAAPNPPATGTSSLLVDVDLTATTSAGNVFSAGDFRLERPGGAPIAAQTLVDKGAVPSSLQLRGRDSARATVVFQTDSLVRDLGGYALRVDRDERVPAVLPLTGTAPAPPYPAGLEAGAAGAITSALTSTCTDRYTTTVRSASTDLEADLGSSSGVKRAKRGRRWFTVVLQVTNVTPAGRSSTEKVCDAFSGAYSTVEIRLQADGRAVAPANPPSFEPIKPGSSAERTHVFEVGATARSLALTGPSGEDLGRWAVDLPAAPGEG